MQRVDWPLLLYYITARGPLAHDDTAATARLLDRIEQAGQAGVDWIQLREKDLSASALQRLAAAAKQRLAGTGTKLLVNSRADIAIACGLDGVHLRSGPAELSASEARTILARGGIAGPLVGVSCHSGEEVLRAESHGADFAVFGPVFGKNEPAGLGVGALASACNHARSIKVLALGGITAANAAECKEAGAAGIAGIRLFQGAKIAGTVRALRAI